MKPRIKIFSKDEPPREGLARANFAACALMLVLTLGLFPLSADMQNSFEFLVLFFAPWALLILLLCCLAIYSVFKLKISAFEKLMWIVWLSIFPFLVYPILNREIAMQFSESKRLRALSNILCAIALCLMVCFLAAISCSMIL